MPRFRNIRVKMANGRSRIQRAQVLASGKLKFVKNTGRTVHRHAKRAHKAVKHRIRRRRTSRTRTRAPIRHRNNRKRSTSKPVVGRNFLKKIPLINNPTVRKVFIAAGAVSIIVSVLSLVSPRAAAAANSTIGRGVIGLATGDVVGAVANVAIPLVQGGGLGNVLGGGNGGNGGNGSNGFA